MQYEETIKRIAEKTGDREHYFIGMFPLVKAGMTAILDEFRGWLTNPETLKAVFLHGPTCPNCGSQNITSKRTDDFLTGEIEMITECLECHHQPHEDYFPLIEEWEWHGYQIWHLPIESILKYYSEHME